MVDMPLNKETKPNYLVWKVHIKLLVFIEQIKLIPFLMLQFDATICKESNKFTS